MPRRFTDFIRRLWRAYLTILTVVENLNLGSLFVALPSTAEEESQVTFESIGSAISFLHHFCMKFTFVQDELFGTDSDQNRITWGNPQKWFSDSLPLLLGHLGVRAPYATRRKLQYEANQVWMNTTFISQGPQSWGKLAVETW
jgi:hypothetical protein